MCTAVAKLIALKQIYVENVYVYFTNIYTKYYIQTNMF